MKAKRHQLPADRRWPLSPRQVYDELDQAGTPHPSWIRRSRPYRPQHLSTRNRAGRRGTELVAASSLILTVRWSPPGSCGRALGRGP
jgi:hypothetical protein